MRRPPRRYPRLICLGFLASLALCGCASRDVNQFVGRNPKQVYLSRFLVDQTIMQSDESKPSVDWGLSLVWQGDHYLLSADHNIVPNQPVQTWQIVAVQDIPLLKKGQMLAMGTCKHNGHHDSRVVAIVDYDAGKQWFDHIVADWAYDFEKNGFISYPTVNIQCSNTLYGWDRVRRQPVLVEAPAPATRPQS